jgi:hypothetical protein
MNLNVTQNGPVSKAGPSYMLVLPAMVVGLMAGGTPVSVASASTALSPGLVWEELIPSTAIVCSQDGRPWSGHLTLSPIPPLTLSYGHL